MTALVWAIFAVSAVPASPHHSFSAQFDPMKKITLKGHVTKVDWVNPHSYVYLDVKDDRGRIVNWAIEGSSPNVLEMRGWTRNTIRPGDQVTALGFPAKDGSYLILAVNLTLPDGQKMVLGVE
ncbi:MAG TPA: DUF6152 family protein [Terriglobia bacterium]|nr:DUF6152 family protein [Terriglobia bacterium]